MPTRLCRYARLVCIAVLTMLRTSVAAQPSPPNVIVVLLDTLRADRLGVYGNRNGLTPYLDELARRHSSAIVRYNHKLHHRGQLADGGRRGDVRRRRRPGGDQAGRLRRRSAAARRRNAGARAGRGSGPRAPADGDPARQLDHAAGAGTRRREDARAAARPGLREPIRRRARRWDSRGPRTAPSDPPAPSGTRAAPRSAPGSPSAAAARRAGRCGEGCAARSSSSDRRR